MKLFWMLVYNIIVVPFLWILFMAMGIFNYKFRRGIKGRKNLFENLEKQLNNIAPNSKIIWFHSSSLGEFEQAKPIIAEMKKRYPEFKIAVSFFSPSGFEPSRKYKFADIITYLPFDSYKNAKKFLSIINPAVAIIMRYDLWPNHIWRLKNSNTPIILANATMRENTNKLLPVLKSFHRYLYESVNYVLTVSDTDFATFNKFRLKNPIINKMGDTRFDQVLQRSIESRKKHIIPEHVLKNKKVFVVGSSWEADENIILPFFLKLQNIFENLLMILVPHEPTEENLDKIESELNGKTTHIRFSNLNDYNNERIIIVDSIGILMTIYQYAHLAYVGGSFKSGVHNVLEPAVYGIPVIYGPNHLNSQEAVSMLKEDAAYSANNQEEIYKILYELIHNDSLRSETGEKASVFIKKNIGATQKFFTYFEKVI